MLAIKAASMKFYRVSSGLSLLKPLDGKAVLKDQKRQRPVRFLAQGVGVFRLLC